MRGSAEFITTSWGIWIPVCRCAAPRNDGSAVLMVEASVGTSSEHRSLSVILRCPANGRASKDERPPICRGIDPGRRPSRLASLAPQGDGEGDRSGFFAARDLVRKPSSRPRPETGRGGRLAPSRRPRLVRPMETRAAARRVDCVVAAAQLAGRQLTPSDRAVDGGLGDTRGPCRTAWRVHSLPVS